MFPRDGHDADGRCKKYLGMVLEGAGWRRGCPIGIPERPQGLVPGPNRSWGETGASVPGRAAARQRRPQIGDGSSEGAREDQFAALIGSAGFLAPLNLLGCYFKYTLKRGARRKAAL